MSSQQNKNLALKKSKRVLGRGFESLLPTDFDRDLVLDNDERIQKIAIDSIVADQEQPRRHFDQQSLEELASSIKVHGILLPLVVIKYKDDKYQIVAGERRWRAAKIVGLNKVPAVVRSMDKFNQLQVSLIENVQRVDLKPLEQALTIAKLHEQFSITYDDIAIKIGKAKSTVMNMVRLLNLPQDAKDALNNNIISEGHARTILSLKDNTLKQKQLLDYIIKDSWNVRQAEHFVSKKKEKNANTNNSIRLENHITKQLSVFLGLPVSLKKMTKGGRLEIRYNSEEQLDKITELLSK